MKKPNWITLYSIWDNRTDEVIIIDGTAEEAAAATGKTVGNFYCAVSRTRSGRIHKWHIETRRVRSKRKRKPYPYKKTGARLFTVRNNITGEIVAEDLPSEECWQRMGLKSKRVFYYVTSSVYGGANHKWTITSRLKGADHEPVQRME